jgi:dienelactone hydrolase
MFRQCVCQLGLAVIALFHASRTGPVHAAEPIKIDPIAVHGAQQAEDAMQYHGAVVVNGALKASDSTQYGTDVVNGAQYSPSYTLSSWFSKKALLGNKTVSKAECDADPPAVFVTVDGDEACIRYRMADESGGTSKSATFYIHDDKIVTADGINFKAVPKYENVSPYSIWREASRASRISRSPFIHLARPGVFGSSGSARTYANTKREVKLLDAAIDAIKREQGFDRIGLAGHSRSGAIVATLAAQRSDVRCAAASSSFLAVKNFWLGRNPDYNTFDLIRLNDPIDALAKETLNRDLRFFYVSDKLAETLNVPSEESYFSLAAAKGFPVTRIEADAPDPDHHYLYEQALWAVSGCMDGRPTEDISALVRAMLTRPGPGPLEFVPPRTIYPPRPADGSEVSSKPQDMGTTEVKDAVEGIKADRARCVNYPTAVWVTVEGRQDCVRYFYSDAGGSGPDAIVQFPGDLTRLGEDGKIKVVDGTRNLHAGTFDADADMYSRTFGGPVIIVARPGLFGSPRHETDIRYSKREVALVGAALDEIRMRHRIRTFHMAGQSGGGRLALNLASKRGDVGCAVSGSGDVALRLLVEKYREKRPVPAAWRDQIADPYEQVDALRGRKSLRLFLLADEKDIMVPIAVAEAYARRLADRKIPHTLIRTTAFGPKRHGLAEHATRAAIACALGGSDAEVVDIVEKSVDLWDRRGEFNKRAVE